MTLRHSARLDRVITIDGRMPYYPVILYAMALPLDMITEAEKPAPWVRRRETTGLICDHGIRKEKVVAFREEWNRDGFQILVASSKGRWT